ncbi:hypothetical protein FB45DRAFT_889602 [Roridomyces roridus]|uniref:Uncharacterized protein n=1 Tax=Roridomyces roridus TaxID=1738132 RepID=A0AAD7FZG4_9AGAR|nr:hypothetical protein FB45DRAFT_889602 [Roridomyces roridus]
MSALSTQYAFRRRRMGRAASPPIWTCYEQIHDDEDVSDSGSESCSEDEEDYAGAGAGPESESEDSDDAVPRNNQADDDDVAHDMEMDVDAEGVVTAAGDQSKTSDAQAQKDVKGKQRAIDPEPEAAAKQRRHQRKKQRQQARAYTLRPILTIQRSQGFVWNQDLFVPPYIKDRYVASTSPPSSSGFISTSVSSTNSALTDYEVEVVEIRVQEGEFDGIIP